ncbi:MAG: ATP-dependent helicase [Clostridiales bacterium]|nr:ATP-dependent helicase [Clostridiales bacterium]
MEMNWAQKQAVQHKDGPMLVLAGPGSGKTFVITERTRYLIEEYKIPEKHILVITFTKAAANEMKDRFLKRMKVNYTAVSYGTFHAIFFTILKYAYHLNASNIVREEVRNQFLRETIQRLDLEYEDEKEFISDIASEISLVKGEQIDLANYYSSHCASDVFKKIYQEYDKKLRRANLIDFDDMLVLCYQLLSERKDILALWQNKFQYILIDEFQDINRIQYEIVKMLAAPHNNLFIVGDDDQSIYRFRGAKPEIMLKFPKDYPDGKRILLDKNYRSQANIVAASSKLIKNNEQRYDKAVNAVRASGSSIVIKNFETLTQENKTLAEEIIKLNKKGIALNNMAILIRTNMGSEALLHKLMEYNIPFRMKDNLPNIFDHWIARDIISYIKIAMGNWDRRLFLQIINKPKRYVSRECFDRPEVNLDDIKEYYEDKNWMLERLDQLEYDLAMLCRMKPYAAVNYIRRGIGYEEYLQEYAQLRKIKYEELLDVLDELQENAKNFESFGEWLQYMKDYKEELLRQFEENRNKNVDSVTIATMHSSKGLEFDVVFIVDANEGITPHKKAILDADIEEERRLFYVAMTRAKDHLYIYSSKERYNKTMEASRFIAEIQ